MWQELLYVITVFFLGRLCSSEILSTFNKHIEYNTSFRASFSGFSLVLRSIGKYPNL